MLVKNTTGCFRIKFVSVIYIIFDRYFSYHDVTNYLLFLLVVFCL